MTDTPRRWRPGLVTLEWPAGHYLHGLEIVCRRRPLGEVLDLWVAGSGSERPLEPQERADQLRRNADELASLIVEWNADDSADQAVPATGEGLLSILTNDDIDDVWDAYRQATSRVPPPLPQNSDAGSPSAAEELELPMEPLSDSPETSKDS